MTDAPAFGEATIDDCEREPIHIPGSVQPHGAVVVVADGIVVQCSANAATVLGLDAPLLGRPLVEALGSAAGDLTGVDTSDDDRGRHASRVTIGSRSLDVSHTSAPGASVFELEAVDEDEEPADLHQLVAAALAGLQQTTGSTAVVDELCRVVQALTGFDRVMGYQFQPDDHGVVVAEVRQEHLESFLGLHYPASDIPPQARRLYLDHWLRLIPDAAYEPVPLEPTMLPTTGEPLDLSSVGCRSVSPIHCQYLTNMGVRASMSISLVVEGRLWGLVACHHYEDPRRPAPSVRDACELVALSASVLLGARLAEERAQRQLHVEERLHRLAEQLHGTDDLGDGLLSDPGEVLGLLDADGACLVTGRQVRSVGRTPDDGQVVDLAEELGSTRPGETIVTAAAAAELAPLADAIDVAAGVVALPLSSLQRNYLMWFRPRWRHEVRWAGQPTKAITRATDGTSRLVPRESFAEWVESVEDQARPWPDGASAIAARVRELLARHISRTVDELAHLNAELARSNAELDAFAYVAAHDLKEPLRGLANYAAFLSEDYGDVLDDPGRDQLDQMIQLAGRMGGLLGSLLEYARAGRSELQRTTVPLSEIMEDVTELLRARIEERQAEVVLVGDGEVEADIDLLTQVLMNLVSNGIKYNESTPPRIEVGFTRLFETARGRELVPLSPMLDVDTPVLYVADNGIGIAPEMVEDIFRVFRRLHRPEEYGGGEGAGLTIARRIVARHGGVIWVESEEGAGSTFHLTLGKK